MGVADRAQEAALAATFQMAMQGPLGAVPPEQWPPAVAKLEQCRLERLESGLLPWVL